MTYQLVIGAVAAYLLGSIPFGLVLSRLGGYGDIRKIGSGNIGATNVLRTGNKALAAATLILDAAKGAVAVLILSYWGVEAASVGAIAASTEIFGWMQRNPNRRLARVLAKPGHELQHRLSTAEPSPEQLEVAQAALDACLELERSS